MARPKIKDKDKEIYIYSKRGRRRYRESMRSLDEKIRNQVKIIKIKKT